MATKRKPKHEHKPAGQPTKFDARYVEEARKLALLGATDREMAAFWNVTEQTVNNWKKAHPEFFESLNIGKFKADMEVASKLYHRAIGYEHSAVKIFMPANAAEPVYAPYTERFPPETTAAIFWLKNRRKTDWRDRQDLELSGGVDVALHAKSDAELQAEIARLAARLGASTMVTANATVAEDEE